MSQPPRKERGGGGAGGGRRPTKQSTTKEPPATGPQAMEVDTGDDGAGQGGTVAKEEDDYGYYRTLAVHQQGQVLGCAFYDDVKSILYIEQFIGMEKEQSDRLYWLSGPHLSIVHSQACKATRYIEGLI